MKRTQNQKLALSTSYHLQRATKARKMIFLPLLGVICTCTIAFTASKKLQVQGFVPSCLPQTVMARPTVRSKLWYVSTDLPDISEMKASEMKKELESYGVSTKSLFDKTEFEKALKEARVKQERLEVADIKDRINIGNDKERVAAPENGRKTVWGRRNGNRKKWSSREPAKSETSTTSKSSTTGTRDERYQNALQEGIAMKLSELKQELKDRGISTEAFFEKVDMAKAYAEAIADNILKKKPSTSTASGGRQHRSQSDEVWDPSYRDVEVRPFDASTMLAGETVIDITDFVKGATAAGV
mmetsp:Transcript_12096/g.22488  ORF Transcript_12096/g.22488 Transcript_12096/m.22488 type:complete len:299 (-) Transcript_12096:71-967(-)